MQGLIDCGKYKVTEVLSSHSGFEAALCSDVTVNDGTVYMEAFPEPRCVPTPME